MATAKYFSKSENMKMQISEGCLKKIEECIYGYLATLPINEEKRSKITNNLVKDAKKRFTYLHCYSVNTAESGKLYKELIKAKVSRKDISPLSLIIRTNEQIAISTKYGNYPSDI